MAYWIMMLLCELALPVIMLLVGIVFENSAPAKINRFYGYRTKRSMKNQDTWEFANRYMGGLWKKLGLILLPLSIIPMLAVIKCGETVVGAAASVAVTVQLAAVFVTIALVERELKRKFDSEGNRK